MPPRPEPDPVTDPKGWLAWYEEQKAEAAAATNVPKPSAAPGATTGAPAVRPPTSAALPGTTPGYTPYTPRPYGDLATTDIWGKTIPTAKPNERVDPVTRQRYSQGDDGTWRTAGFVLTSDVQPLIRQYGLPPERTQEQNAGLRGNIAASASPNAGLAGTAGTVPKWDGITVPGFEAFNVPGAGFSAEGRKTLKDDYELNRLNASDGSRGPQIQFGPGLRYGRAGNSIGFGGSRSDYKPDYNIDPQTRFAPVEVSVPTSYVKGAGNTGDFNRAIEVPFNIGPGGAASYNLAGSNVQVNSADKGTGYGFALTPQTPSDKFAATDVGMATGRTLSSDPAIAAAQTLMLNAAIQQAGGGPGAISMLTTPQANQYSGNPTTNQGTYFAGMAPGPQNNPYPGGGSAALPPMGPNPANPTFTTSTSTATNPGTAMGPAFGSDAAVAAALAAAARDEEERRGGGDGGYMRGFRTGGTVTMLPRNARASRPLGFANGGSVTTTASATPTWVTQPNGTVTYGTAPATAATTTAPATTAPAESGVAPAFDPLATTILDPFRRMQREEADLDRARASTAYQWGIAGRAAPTAIDVPIGGQTGGEPLKSGQYYSRIKALNERINNVTGLQEDYTALGPLGDPTTLLGNIATTKQAMAPYEQAQALAVKRAALGTNLVDPVVAQGQIADFRQRAGPLAAIAEARERLSGMGNKYDDGTLSAQASAIQAAKDQVSQYANSDPYTDPFGYAAGQQAAASLTAAQNHMSQMLSHNNGIDQVQNTYYNLMQQNGFNLDNIGLLDEKIGEYTSQINDLTNRYNSAIEAQSYDAQIAALVNGRDPNVALAEYGTQLEGFNRGMTNYTRGQELTNRIKGLVTGFKKGGTVKTIPLGKAKRSKKSMVTNEPITGIGEITGERKFRVGEPRRPGGPPAPEKLTITPLPFPKRAKAMKRAA